MVASPHQGVKLGPGLGLGSQSSLRGSFNAQATESAGDAASTLALKPMGRVNQSPKQRVPVAPQNGDLSAQKKCFKKN